MNSSSTKHSNGKVLSFLPKKWGNLPSLEELEKMHIDTLIEEMGDIREEVGYYLQLRKKPGLSPKTVALLDDTTGTTAGRPVAG